MEPISSSDDDENGENERDGDVDGVELGFSIFIHSKYERRR